MKLLKLFTVRNLILLVIVWLLWKNVVSQWLDINYNLPLVGAGTIENYGDPHLHYSCWKGHELEGCEPAYTATKQCHEFAQSACNTTNDRLNKCWMPAFLKCTASSPNSLCKANCHKYADAYCGGSPGECAECYSNAHQMCMAEKGLGAQPNCPK